MQLTALLLALQAQLPPALLNTDADNPWPPTLANGEFGTTIAPLGLHPQGRHAFRTVLAGVWNGPLFRNDGWPNYQLYLPELPCPAQLSLRLGGTDLLAGKPEDYRQQLDLAHGTLTTSFAVPRDGGRVDVAIRQFASRVRPELFATEVTLTSPTAAELTATAVLDLVNARGVRWVGARQDAAAARHVLRLRTQVAETQDYDCTDIELAQALDLPGGGEAQPWQAEDRLQLVRRGALAAGQPFALTLLTTLRSSRHGPLQPFYGTGPLQAARAAGFRALLAEHQDAWQTFWQGTRIEIDGDDALQRVADSGLYWLCSALRPGGDDSLGPMGLSKIDKNSYAGHVFWDAETWMYPPLLLLQPELARSMLEYRFTRMEGARQNAILKGVTGDGAPWNSRALYYPWESARSGQEATPQWFVPSDEIHNNACIALAFWQFAQLHGDAAFASGRAAPVTAGIADFYAARAAHEADGKYHLRHVTGADEWADRKDDFAYVNGTAKRALQIAAAFAQRPEPRWQQVADGLLQPFDEALGIHPEYDGYDGRKIKQADVVLMSYPWALVADPLQVRRDLEYYAQRTATEAPAMSRAIHAILWARLGDEQKALAELDAAWRRNVHGPFLLWSETPNNGCINFLTGIGGFLQALLNGFGGVQVVDGGLDVRPLLPQGWRRLSLRGLCVGEATFELRIERGGARLVPMRGEVPPGRVRLR